MPQVLKKVLIVGAGSIGTRHAKNFLQLNCDVAFLTKRKDMDVRSFQNMLEALKEYKPDVVFICNETAKHAVILSQLIELEFHNLIVVEKPIFDRIPENLADFSKLNIKVSYNLRFHPLVEKLKKEVGSQKVLKSLFYVGQYLPTWRANVDYASTYSARKSLGGGVLRDLSHELDLGIFMQGEMVKYLSLQTKVSDLKIDTDDSFSVIAQYNNCPHCLITMNYLDKMTNRFIILHTESDSYKIDFIAKTFTKNSQTESISYDANDSYLGMTKNIIFENAKALTSFNEACDIVRFIEAAEASNANMRLL